MGMTVTLDRMIHANAVHHELGKEIGLEGCCAYGGAGKDLNPIDLVAMGVASCLMIVMAKLAQGKGLDLSGTWADTAYDLKDYQIASITVAIHSPYSPTESERELLEKEAHTCPVYLALKDGVAVKVAFEWGTTAAAAAKKAGKSCCQCDCG
jgi:putative redox protein